MRSSALFVGLCVIFSIQNICKAHWDAAYFHNANDGFTLNLDWMAKIRDDVKLSEMALPGTHDSGTYKVGSNWFAATQCLSFEEQLKYGIRVFDIRVRHFHDNFVLHHGRVYLDLNFDSFLQPVERFLVQYPSETVLFRLRVEYEKNEDKNTRSLKATLESYLKRYSKFLQTIDRNIKLSQARGRFIILADNNEFLELGLYYNLFKIQDYYNLGSNFNLYKKWEQVNSHLHSATNGDANEFYVNYLSGSGSKVIPLTKIEVPTVFPYFVASGHSSPGTNAPRLSTGRTTPAFKNSWVDFPRVACFIGICTIAYEGTNVLTRYKIPEISGRRTVGIIMADFPGKTLIETIIENNRNLRLYESTSTERSTTTTARTTTQWFNDPWNRRYFLRK